MLTDDASVEHYNLEKPIEDRELERWFVEALIKHSTYITVHADTGRLVGYGIPKWTVSEFWFWVQVALTIRTGGKRGSMKMNDVEHIRTVSASRFHPTRTDKYDLPWLIEDASMSSLASLVVGRTITSIVREPGCSTPANGVEITLDDGSKISFDGWGHSDWGLSTGYEPAPVLSFAQKLKNRFSRPFRNPFFTP